LLGFRLYKVRMTKRLLFITANRVGDAVLSTGVLDRLIRQHPGIRVTVVCGNASAGLFESVPFLERVVPLRKKPWSFHWFDMWRACILKRWDIVVDCRNAPLSHLLFSSRSHHMGRDDKTEHRVVRYARMIGLENNPPTPRLWLDPVHEAVAKTLIPGDAPVVAIAPTANWMPKIWPPRNFVSLIERLTSNHGVLPDAKVAVFAHESERAIADKVTGNLPGNRVIDLVGGPSLLEIYACFKRCRFFIGNDSGLMHMAAASGVATLGLFGPSRINLYAPWGERAGVATTGKPHREHFPKRDSWLQSDSLMGDLKVETAERAARKIWFDAEGGDGT